MPGLWGEGHNHAASFGSAAAVAAVSIASVWWILASAMVLTYPEKSVWWKSSAALKAVFGLLTLVPFLISLVILHTGNGDIPVLPFESGRGSTSSIRCSLSGARTAARILRARISESTT